MQHSRRYRNNTINWLLHILCILVYITYNQYFEVFCYNLYLAPSNLVSTTISAVWPPVQIRNCLYAGYAGLHWHLNSTNKTKKIVLSVKFSEITQRRQKRQKLTIEGKHWKLLSYIYRPKFKKNATFTFFSLSESSPSQPQYVFWYHNDRMVNYDTERGVRLN